MTNKTLVRIRVWVRAWIKIYIRHTENTELFPWNVKPYFLVVLTQFNVWNNRVQSYKVVNYETDFCIIFILYIFFCFVFRNIQVQMLEANFQALRYCFF